MPDEVQQENASAISTVLQAANIDTNGLVVPDATEIEDIEDDVEAALIADRAFRALHIATGRAWIVMGEYAEIVHRRQLWKHLMSEQGVTFTSFKDWCQNATNKGRTTVYGEMTLVRELNIPRADLMRISKANAFTLLKVKRRAGASKITPELIEAAASMDDPAFQKYCLQFLPGAAADELQTVIKFSVPDSLGERWRSTVEMLQVLLQTNDWEQIIEQMIVATDDAAYGNPNGTLAALEGMSNREAYNRIVETLEATGNKIKRSGRQMKGAALAKEPVTAEASSEYEANTEALVEGEQVVIEDSFAPADDVNDKLAALDDDGGWDDDDDDETGGDEEARPV